VESKRGQDAPHMRFHTRIIRIADKFLENKATYQFFLFFMRSKLQIKIQ